MTEETEMLDEAFRAYAEKDLEKAAEILSGISVGSGPGRALKIQVLTDLDRRSELIDLLQEPRSADELMVLIEALCGVRLYQRARDALREGSGSFRLSPDISAQIEAKIDVAEIAP